MWVRVDMHVPLPDTCVHLDHDYIYIYMSCCSRHAKSMYGVRPNCNFGPKASIMKTHTAVM